VCGSISPSTVDHKNYYIVFIDEFTHCCVTYLLSYKSEVVSVFEDCVAKTHALFNLNMVNLYIDNGREYLSIEMKEFCVQKGITYHLTVSHTPQQNDVSERMIRSITEIARALVIGGKVQKTFWGEAVLTATYLTNRSPTSALHECRKTPFEMWHSKKECLRYLRDFGSIVYVLNKTRKRKLDDKSWKGNLSGMNHRDIEYGMWRITDLLFQEM